MTKQSPAAGFTLIELLIVITTVFVLTTLSLQSLALYKKRAFDTAADQMLNQISVALESGRIDDKLTNPPDWRTVTVHDPGPLQDPAAVDFLPGLSNSKEVLFTAERNGVCEVGQMGDVCVIDWVQVRHCRGSTQISRFRFRDGTEELIKANTDGLPSC